MRPYYAEGSKTLGYEVAEQLGWRLPGQVVISQIYGGGGNAGASLKNDFIELFNRGIQRVVIQEDGAEHAALGIEVLR